MLDNKNPYDEIFKRIIKKAKTAFNDKQIKLHYSDEWLKLNHYWHIENVIQIVEMMKALFGEGEAEWTICEHPVLILRYTEYSGKSHQIIIDENGEIKNV